MLQASVSGLLARCCSRNNNAKKGDIEYRILDAGIKALITGDTEVAMK